MKEPSAIENKVNELVVMLQHEPIGKDQALQFKQKLNDALDASFPKSLEAFKELDATTNRFELMDDLELLLSQHQLDSTASKKYLYRERLSKSLVVCIGVTMIVLGLGMIIMPAPPYFEMFTIYYFTPNDGITIMDVISVLIIFTGVYLLINALIKKPKTT